MINAKNFGLACGIIWGAAMLILGLTTTWFNYGGAFVNLFGAVYIGYSAGLIGAIIGAVWGCIDAFIGGFILIWLYNKLEGQ